MSGTSEDGLPPVDPHWVYTRIFICACIDVLAKEAPPEAALALIRSMAEMFATEQSMETVIPIRGSSSYSAVVASRREAKAMFDAHLPIYVARLPRRDT